MLITSIRFRSRRLHGRRGLKYAGVIIHKSKRQSPPSRAAWIEMLRAVLIVVDIVSPPSRAAWIEIAILSKSITELNVAAFTGGVD